MTAPLLSYRPVLALVLFLGLLASSCTAQQGGYTYDGSTKPKDYGIRSKKALNFYIDGMIAFRYRGYKEAEDYMRKALELEPEFFLAKYHLGRAIFFITRESGKRSGEVVQLMNWVLEHKGPGYGNGLENLHYFLGHSHWLLGNYRLAIEHYTKYLEGSGVGLEVYGPFAETSRGNIVRAEFADYHQQNPLDIELKNLGAPINTKFEEYLPYLTADDQTLFFTSRRPENAGEYDPLSGGFPEDFYIAHRQPDGSWGDLKPLGPPINTPDNEGAACISPDGQWVIFTGCNRQDGEGSCDLYIARLIGNRWTEPRNMGDVINSRWWDSHPNLSNDGRTLYFVSSRPGGFGATDIWYSRLENGRWTEPKNMGPTINTPGQEYGPFLHADGVTLYFSSDTHLGFGGMDFFMSTRMDTGWTKPVNLGSPLNTPRDEQNIFINAFGTEAYINVNAEDGAGGFDLYSFALPERIRPQQATFVRGIVLDSTTRAPLLAEVEFIDVNTGDTIRAVQTNEASGRFLLSLPLERQYAAFVQRQGYLFQSKNFSLEGLQGQPYYDLEILLQPVAAGARVVLNNIFFEFDSYGLLPESIVELRQVLTFLQRNPNLRIQIQGHTDDQGADDYNLSLSQNRAQAVRDWLVSHGVPAASITAQGFGETQPVATNDTEEGRARNRRIEFLVLK